MNFFNRLTTAGKAVIIILVVAILGAVLYFTGATKDLSSMNFGSSGHGDADVVISTNTYAGFLPIIAANHGLEPNEESDFYKKFGIKLKIIVQDNLEASTKSLESGDIDVRYCTLDALPTQMSSDGTLTDVRYFMLLNFSSGADVIVANNTINTVADLKGKTIAVAESTASHTLLLNTLETSGLKESDIKKVVVESGVEAAQAFKAKQVDCCVAWAPDHLDCIKSIKGAHVLTSTAQANQLVSDGLIAKKEWLDDNHELAKKLVEGILWANSECSNNPTYFNEGCKYFAEGYGTEVEFAQETGKLIHFATLADEKNWMGLNNTEYTGQTGESIYTKMSRVYTNLGLAKSVMGWSKIADTSIIEELDSKTIGNKQDANGTATTKFSEISSDAGANATAISSKKIVIDFPVGSCSLDNNARNIIDREFVDIAKNFEASRIRVVGNTSNTGNYASNVALSQKRAQAVVNYLVSEYKMPKNKFIVVGNGPKKAVDAGNTTESAEFRTTDLEIIAQ